MTGSGPDSLRGILAGIQAKARAEELRVTLHAHREMADEGIPLDAVLEAITQGEIIEHYPEHKRGPCCLLHGMTGQGRHLHVVCTTNRPVLVIITVYEPRPPKWPTPTRRRKT